MAETAEAQAAAEGRRELARILRDTSVRAEQIERDRAIRELELRSDLAVKIAKHDTEIQLSAKKAEEAAAETMALASVAAEASAHEAVATARETAMAERVKALAVIKAEETAAVDDKRVESQAATVRALAAADADAAERKAGALRAELLAKAEGDAAVYVAQNTQTEAVIRLKTDLAKIAALPEIVREMVKPAEKIESIRINHVSGFGPTAGGSTSPAGAPMVNQIVDGILAMALQLPAVKKLGEEIGLNIGGGIDQLTGDVASSGGSATPRHADLDQHGGGHAGPVDRQ